MKRNSSKYQSIDLASEIRGFRSTPKSTLSKSNNKMSTPTKHSHPSSKGNIKRERVHIEDSLGKHQSEGCKEHYYERYILIDKQKEKTGLNKDLARIVVLGEVINNPAFKRNKKW